MIEYNHIIVRYGEITLKQRNRNTFIEQLRRNVKGALADFPNVKIEARHERMMLTLNGENHTKVIERIRKVFGIHSVTPAFKAKKDLQSIKDISLEYINQLETKPQKFKVETKRADKSFPIGSEETSREIGAHILINAQPITVDVHNPDLVLKVEIKPEAVFISGETFKAVGGLPVGTSGRAMLMLSGGIDSPVAGYLMMKRGVEIESVHFESPPFTSDKAKQKVIDLAEKLSHINGKMVLHVVPFTEIQKTIHEKIPANYTITVMRRVMIKIVERLRIKREAMAIVTGENLGQVASQTIESMFTINEVTNTPILRPLISHDKSEIMDLAREIDTYEISIRPFEDCCTIFKPANPKTKPIREKVNHFESFVDFNPLIDEAIENIEKVIFTDRKKKEKTVIDELF
ncbi:MAG: thiI [Bacillales bacterium]|jgi:thiamine biosynthesis protein ThiI|nr:thiI [Bacillales bacterium]